MRTGISITVSAADRRRLAAIVADRNAAQKHVWRARIVLLTADGLGTQAIIGARLNIEPRKLGRPARDAAKGGFQPIVTDAALSYNGLHLFNHV